MRAVAIVLLLAMLGCGQSEADRTRGKLIGTWQQVGLYSDAVTVRETFAADGSYRLEVSSEELPTDTATGRFRVKTADGKVVVETCVEQPECATGKGLWNVEVVTFQLDRLLRVSPRGGPRSEYVRLDPPAR